MRTGHGNGATVDFLELAGVNFCWNYFNAFSRDAFVAVDFKAIVLNFTSII